MKLIAIAAASVLLMAGAAQAQSARQVGGTYAEIGYTQLKLSGEGENLKPGALRGIFGYEFHPNAAVEGMVAFGIRNEERNESVDTGVGIATATAKVKLKNAYGVYLKPKANVSDALEVFGRLGYTHMSFKVDASVSIPGVGSESVSDSGSDGGISYGLGANYKFSPTTYVGVDYMRYYKKDGVTVDGVTVGVGFRF